MVIKWINEKAAWFFTNGNKNNSLAHVKERYGPYRLVEHEDTVTITMSKIAFIQSSKFARYGLDCFKYGCLPKWEPKLNSAKSINKVIEAMNYDAHMIGTKFYKERLAKKS
jgi:hypothetical protein